MRESEPDSVSTALRAQLERTLAEHGGWIGFDRFMDLALYSPGLGYYANDSRKFGPLPSSGSDFVTAPEMTPLFGRALARQVAQALAASGTREVFEFGAGSGALAEQLIRELDELKQPLARYTIVDLSASLRERQQARLAPCAGRVRWLRAWPDEMQGVVVGNELLDSMPVQLLHWDGKQWFERGVAPDPRGAFTWSDRPTALRPPWPGPFAPATTLEIHPQAEAFVATLAERLQRGAAFFIDYGFPEAEYYHPQRAGGTLMCHRAHRADDDPLAGVGLKDITAHVNFSAIALAGQEAGLEVLGYATQARFLLNCGLLDLLDPADLRARAASLMLLNEHEMGELFKVIAFAKGCSFDPLGFAEGDRTHRL